MARIAFKVGRGAAATGRCGRRYEGGGSPGERKGDAGIEGRRVTPLFGGGGCGPGGGVGGARAPAVATYTKPHRQQRVTGEVRGYYGRRGGNA